jgi:hypothetical protein
VLPETTPDVGRYVRKGPPYLQEHYVPFALWATILLALACTVVAVMGHTVELEQSVDAPIALV